MPRVDNTNLSSTRAFLLDPNAKKRARSWLKYSWPSSKKLLYFNTSLKKEEPFLAPLSTL
jgi:hypothetical protein